MNPNQASNALRALRLDAISSEELAQFDGQPLVLDASNVEALRREGITQALLNSSGLLKDNELDIVTLSALAANVTPTKEQLLG